MHPAKEHVVNIFTWLQVWPFNAVQLQFAAVHIMSLRLFIFPPLLSAVCSTETEGEKRGRSHMSDTNIRLQTFSPPIKGRECQLVPKKLVWLMPHSSFLHVNKKLEPRSKKKKKTHSKDFFFQKWSHILCISKQLCITVLLSPLFCNNDHISQPARTAFYFSPSMHVQSYSLVRL